MNTHWSDTSFMSIANPIRRLELLFRLMDSEDLFSASSPENLRLLRTSMSETLIQCLVWHRPELEASRGLAWPYESLNRRVSFFRQQAESPNAFIRTQAKLFLSLLPFPGQWRRIISEQTELGDRGDFKSFIATEQRRINRKLLQKHDKEFKLRHFCQILKRPRLPGEKGILRIFSMPYLFIFSDLLDRISRSYVLYVEPPMGIVFRHSWWRHFTRLSDPCLFGVGSEEDTRFLEHQDNILTTRLAHGDFLEDIDLSLSPRNNPLYDIVFNATFDDIPRKRHLQMLSLLHHPLMSRTRVLFLGRGEPETVNRFQHHVREHGLENRVAVKANLRREDVTSWLLNCRMGVHLSLYENACRSIYEFFRADLPCVISSSMAGMNLDIFTPETGLAVPDRRLPEAIDYVLNHLHLFSPRQWFAAHSGSLNSSRELNRQLKTICTGRGYSWTEDIVALGSSGASRYVNTSDYSRFSDDFKALEDVFSSCPGLPVRIVSD